MLHNKLALITGASSGIGRAIAIEFAKHGARLVLCARRIDRLRELQDEITSAYPASEVHVFELDVRDANAVAAELALLSPDLRAFDILVNNAGLSRGLDKLQEGAIEDWDEMIDTNVKGLLYVTREVVPGMIARGRGHIVNIGSIAGHEVYPKGAVYCASKHAVDSITKGLRMDLVDTPLKVTTIDPGLVETEFSEVRFHGDTARAKKVYEGYEPLHAADIADVVLYAVTRPAHVQIAEMIVFPTAQASATLVHRA